MSLQGVEKVCLEFHPKKRIDVEFSQARLSCDGGLLPVREMDEKIGLTVRFAAALHDACGETARHSNLSMTRQRILGIIAGHIERLSANGSTRPE